MLSYTAKLSVAVVAALMSASAAHAASIWTNPITDTNPSSLNPYTNGDVKNANITVSGIGRGSGVTAASASNRYSATVWNAASQSANSYYSWTLTPNAGFSIGFTDLLWTYQSSNTGATSYQFQYSINGGAYANIPTPVVSGGSLTHTGSQATGTALDLSGSTFAAISTPITFRLYAWGASASNGSFSVNDFTFDGTVSGSAAPTGNFWDGSGATGSTGGSGTWSTSSLTWSTDAVGTTIGTQAVTGTLKFGGATAGAVGITGTVVASSGLEFSTTGYVISGGTALNLSGTTSSANTITTDSSVAATITTPITTTAGLTTAGTGTLTLGGNNAFSGGATISAGKVILAGANTYTGGTTIAATGTLQVGDGTTNGSLVGNVANSGVLVFNRSDTVTYAGIVSGTGSLSQSGSGMLILSGANTPSGGTTISAGTLQIGDGTTNGSLTGNVINNGVLVFNRTDAVPFGGIISGSGAVTKSAAGSLTLTGSNTYSNGTTISGGTLYANNTGGSATGSGAVAVNATASLAGGGSLAGQVTMAIGSTISPGATASTIGQLNIGTSGTALTINGGTYQWEMSNGVGIAGTTGWDLLNVTGSADLSNLSTGNPLTVNMVNLAQTVPFDVGQNYSWPILATTGGITNPNGLADITLKTPSFDVSGGSFGLSTDGNGIYVTFTHGNARNLVWAGTSGAAAWNVNSLNTNWTTASVPTSFHSSDRLTFDDTAANTTVGVDVGGVAAGAINFGNNSKAYTVSGGAITSLSSLTISGTNQVTLANDNTFALGASINSGTLQIGNGGTTGTLTADVSVSSPGTLAFNRTGSFIFANNITGTGSVVQVGGTTVLTGNASHTGGTTINAGTFQIGNGGTTGSLAGNVSVAGTLAFNRTDSVTFAGNITGSGSLIQAGSGTTILTGNAGQTSGTTISAGTLQIGNGGTTGSLAGNVSVTGTLAFNRSDTVSFPGTISGSGSVVKLGSGSLTLSASNGFSGGATVSGGTLLATNANALGSGTASLTNGNLYAAAGLTIANAITVNGAASGQGVAIADWTFETSTPATSGPIAPEVGAGSASGHHASGSSVYSAPAGNGSTHSFSSNYWAIGDYYQFQTSLIGYTNPSFTWDQYSSNTGPGTFQLSYSTDGSSFTNFGSAYTQSASWIHNSVDLSSLSALTNTSSLYIRLTDTSTTSAVLGTVGTGGTGRVDNVIVSASAYNPLSNQGPVGLGTNDLTGGTTTYSGTITLNSPVSLNAAAGATVLFPNGISNGSGTANSITKTGAGTVVLSGNLSYTGLTIVNAGILDLTNVGSSTAYVGGTYPTGLQLNGGKAILSYDGQIGAQTAGVNFDGGTLQMNYGYQPSAQNPSYNFTSTGTLLISKDGSGNDPAIAFISTLNQITGLYDATGELVGTAGGMTKDGDGTLILGAPDHATPLYSGGTTYINNGTLKITGVDANDLSRLGNSNIAVNANAFTGTGVASGNHAVLQLGDDTTGQGVAFGNATTASGYIDLFDGATLVAVGSSSVTHYSGTTLAPTAGVTAVAGTSGHTNNVTVSIGSGSTLTLDTLYGSFNGVTTTSSYVVTHKTGAGTLVLNPVTYAYAASSIYNGNWALDGGTLEVHGTNALGNGSFVNITAAQNTTLHIVAGSDGLVSLNTSGTTTIDAGATLTTNTIQTDTNGALNLAGTLTLTSPTKAASSVNTLNITGAGVLNLGNSDLIVHSSSVGAILAMTQASTPEIASSAVVSGLTTLAVVSGSEYLALGNSTLDSAPVVAGDTIVRRSYLGDANMDGVISAADYLALDLGYLFGLSGWSHGDFLQNGTVGVGDFAAIDNAFKNQSGSVADGEISLHTQWFGAAYTDAIQSLEASAPASVPEPASLGLLVVGAMALLTRRRGGKAVA